MEYADKALRRRYTPTVALPPACSRAPRVALWLLTELGYVKDEAKDEAEAEAWAGHIRSAIEPLLAQQEELEKEEVAPNTHGYHAHHECGLCTHMQHVVMHVRTRTCARAHAHAHARHKRTRRSCVSRMDNPARWLLHSPNTRAPYPRRRNERLTRRIRGVTGRSPPSSPCRR